MNSYKKVVITLCYNNSNVIERSTNQYYSLCKNKPDLHVFLDNNYPIQKEKTNQDIKNLSEKYNAHYLNFGKNFGIREGLKTVYENFEFKDNDRIIFYDSNAFVITKDFDDYLYRILDTERYGYSATTFPINENLSNLYNVKVELENDPIHGISYFKNKPELQRIPGVFSTVACYRFAMTKLVDVNLFDMYDVHFGEVLNTHNRVKEIIKKLDMEVAYLKDVNENFDLIGLEDNLYKRYKVFLRTLKPFNHVSFEEFIQKPELFNTELLINHQVSHVNKQLQYINNSFQ